MIIGYVQNNPIFGEKEKNFEHLRGIIGSTKADLLVLPELFATGYNFVSRDEVARLAEDRDGPTARFLKKLSQLTGATLVGGFIERAKERFYNSSFIVSDGKIIDTYRKIHLFNKEKFYFSPGDRHFKVYDIKGVKIGVMICFDWLFPESCRTLALKGAQVIAHPANLVMPYCQNAMITRCLENRIFAVTANRIGIEKRGDDTFSFTGKSQITSVDGEVLALASQNETAVCTVEIDEKRAANKSLNPFNNLFENRRVGFYFTK